MDSLLGRAFRHVTWHGSWGSSVAVRMRVRSDQVTSCLKHSPVFNITFKALSLLQPPVNLSLPPLTFPCSAVPQFRGAFRRELGQERAPAEGLSSETALRHSTWPSALTEADSPLDAHCVNKGQDGEFHGLMAVSTDLPR